jgi:hypothetical protein
MHSTPYNEHGFECILFYLFVPFRFPHLSLRINHSPNESSVASWRVGSVVQTKNESVWTKETIWMGTTGLAISNARSSPFFIPSFLRFSDVSEENAKVAKWRMHGDFFHPAAWEICKDVYGMTWIEHSLSGSGGVNCLCFYDKSWGGVKPLPVRDCVRSMRTISVLPTMSDVWRRVVWKRIGPSLTKWHNKYPTQVLCGGNEQV